MIEGVSDIHIFDADPENSLLFPGPRRVAEEDVPFIKGLLQRCHSCGKRDFMIAYDGHFFRGRKEDCAVDGVWFSLRAMPPKPPSLDSLPSKMPAAITRMLMSRRLNHGGLVYIAGSPGAGKTTTASAILVSRLMEYGGFAYSVEDPPEMPLNGWHGKGYCRQTWVAGDDGMNWGESLRSVLRSQPTATPVILFLGEVRDKESAAAMIRAASNGFLVVSTGFGNDVPSSLDSLSKLIGQTDADLLSLSSVLRLVLHQRLRDGVLSAQFLASPDGTSPVAMKIRNGQFQHLLSDIQYQANKALLNEDLL